MLEYISKKILYVAPGGLRGFYTLGITTYIKENYNLENYSLYGASAGAWNALYLSYKNDSTIYLNNLDFISKNNYSNLFELQKSMKDTFSDIYNEEDFYINNLNIYVTVFGKNGFRKSLINDFTELDDVMDCCIASSHIPLVSKPVIFQDYNNMLCVDGGMFNKLVDHNNNFLVPDIYITPCMWNNNKIIKWDNLKTLDVLKLVEMGYQDSYKNKYWLDTKFNK